jgi:hypothetical protein
MAGALTATTLVTAADGFVGPKLVKRLTALAVKCSATPI